MHPIRFTGWQVVALVVCCVSPFWFLAADWDDGSEMKATVFGAAICGVAVAVIRSVRGHDVPRDP